MCALQVALSPELGQSGVRSLSCVVSPSCSLSSERVRVSVYPSCKGLGPLGRQWYRGYHHSFRIPDRAAFDYGRLKRNVGFEIRGSLESRRTQELAQLSAEDAPGAVQRAAEGDIAREAEGHVSDDKRDAEKNGFVDVQLEEGQADFGWGEGEEEERGEEAFGEVDLILASRVEDRKTQYLILWRDDHPDSWEPATNIAGDLVAEYEKPWWQAARKADIEKLKVLLEEPELQRDVNAVDENERTALFFAAGLGSEKCVRFLIEEYGADVHWQDKDGFTALHIASGYVHVNTVKALVELGADPDLEDAKGRSALSLAQELLKRTPKANPLQFARRLALDQVVKALDEVMYETVEVEQVLDKRTGEGGIPEYFVKWNDDSENSWVTATDIGEDLIKDYEEGLEYGIVEQVLDRREVDGAVQYFVKWSDGKETWEPEENVGEEVIAEFHSSSSTQ